MFTLITSKLGPVSMEFGGDGDGRWKGQEISHTFVYTYLLI